MNRTGTIFASALLVGFFLAAPVAAQVALVVGSVRDQHGAAVAGATVSTLGASGTRATVTTDAAGTFALPGQGVFAVTIACRYCASRTVPVVPGQPVVAIVRRSDALFDDSPSPADLANLPYAHIESALALRPFTLLRQTTGVLPGSALSDRGLLPTNALLVDAGVPNYDVVYGASPYNTIPGMYEQSGQVATAADAFRYGDRAGSGVVTLDPFGGDNADVGLIGGDTTFRLAAGSDAARVVAGTSSNDTESRQRADAQFVLPLSTAQTLLFGGGTSQGREYGNPSSTFDGNFSFANGAFDDAQAALDLHASFVADRGAYAATSGGLPIDNVWSDADFTAGLATRGAIAGFADVSTRLSTGIYDAQTYAVPRTAGTLMQDRVDAGVNAAGRNYEVTAGVGLFKIGYTGGWGGTSTPSSAALAAPSLQLHLFPASKWSVDLEGSGSFTLPTLWQQYDVSDNYGALVYDRNSLYSATVSYSDNARFRASLEAASQRVRGYTNGLVTSQGVSLTWQVAPAVSLRAWTMYVGDSTAPRRSTSFYPTGAPSDVNALWLTYDNGGAVRVDAIYRRDVLDGQPFEHVDAAISGPIAGHLRWYAGVEDRQRTKYLDVGLRFSQ
ncbi:MAG: carboxypeptidase-like regulatory domain-containing protein [Candidatus Tumulicola sp.]